MQENYKDMFTYINKRIWTVLKTLTYICVRESLNVQYKYT